VIQAQSRPISARSSVALPRPLPSEDLPHVAAAPASARCRVLSRGHHVKGAWTRPGRLSLCPHAMAPIAVARPRGRTPRCTSSRPDAGARARSFHDYSRRMRRADPQKGVNSSSQRQVAVRLGRLERIGKEVARTSARAHLTAALLFHKESQDELGMPALPLLRYLATSLLVWPVVFAPSPVERHIRRGRRLVLRPPSRATTSCAAGYVTAALRLLRNPDPVNERRPPGLCARKRSLKVWFQSGELSQHTQKPGQGCGLDVEIL